MLLQAFLRYMSPGNVFPIGYDPTIIMIKMEGEKSDVHITVNKN